MHLFGAVRFTPAAKEARNPFNYLPFGLGPRNCVGMRLALMELKMAMVYILQRLKFVVCKDTQVGGFTVNSVLLPKITISCLY